MNREETFNKKWDEMVNIMPFDISQNVKPYIKELTDVISEQYAQSKTTELQKEIERLKAENELISVNDYLPIANENVLCVNKEGEFKVCYYNLLEIVYKDEIGLTRRFLATHWKPLPTKPPKDL